MLDNIFVSFSKIPKGASIAIYGAGEVALGLKKDLVKKRKDLKLKFFINTYFSGELDGLKIYTAEELSDKKEEFDYILLAVVSSKTREEIKNTLSNIGVNNYIELESTLLSRYLVSTKKEKFKFGKMFLPTLDYLETHVVDHCNLNCKGCSHFCNLAEEKFIDVESIRKDFVQLSKVYKNIKVIRLMGGEPLLHPEINEIMKSVRASFPYSQIKLATNGLLLPKMKEHFWKTCRDNNIHHSKMFGKN